MIKKTSLMLKVIISLLFVITFISCDEEETKTETVNCSEQVSIPTNNIPFSDDFESNETYTIPMSWTSITEEGSREFLVRSHEGNKFVEMTSFNSNESNKVWLISPKFDFDTMIDNNMSFTLSDDIVNGNPLRLLYSNNYDGSGCPSDFSWNTIGESQVSSIIDNEENGNFYFEPTNDIDISEISGNGVIAFFYEGSENGVTTKIQIDDVRIGQSLAFVPVLTIAGTLEVNNILTANYSPLTDVQGNPINVNYQWYHSSDIDGVNEVLITGATDAIYTLANADSGKYVTVKATVGTMVTTADYVGLITGFNTAPTGGVTISGTSSNVGSTLTADTSSSVDTEGDSLTFVYQWYRADDVLATNETLITGETNVTYIITNDDIGKFITVKVVANDGTFDSAEATASYIAIPYSNKVFINELADPNNETRGRFVELYNDGNTNIDLSGWKLIRYTNGGGVSAEEHHLVGIINANSTFVIGKVSEAGSTTADFVSIFGFAPDQAADPHSDGSVNKVVTPIDSNGDDQILLISPDGATMDIFGVIGEDGSGTTHEFEDGKAVRKTTVTQSNPVWTSSEWNVWNDTGDSGTTNDPQDAPADFTPGVR